MEVETIHVGGRLLDAANLADNVRPHQCAVCGETRRAHLLAVALDSADLARVGLPAGGPGQLCLNHYETAMRLVGPPRPTGNAPTCIGCAGNDPACFGVVAVWPLHPTHADQSTWRACRRHLAEAVATLTHQTTAEEQQP